MGTISIPSNLAIALCVVLSIPTIYLFYSVKKYFGHSRVMGIDHFYPEKYRDVGIVKEGIFKYSNNAMYVFGFLALWIPAVYFMSKTALLMALFSHLYIWIHYYFTESPNMKVIYGQHGVWRPLFIAYTLYSCMLFHSLSHNNNHNDCFFIHI